MMPRMWVWTRIATRKWEDAWMERLRFAGEERLTIQYFLNSTRMRMQVYCDHKKTAVQLKKLFGGDYKELKSSDWVSKLDTNRKPISIRGKLLVCDTQPEALAPGCMPIIIPAGMAFGTGDHITTASCLRFLCDIYKNLPARWQMLDLGTGSGILAIAGEKLGAYKVDATDFDPACVRITKANAKANRCKLLNVNQSNVLKNAIRGKYDLVTANLFSDVLIAAAPRIAATVKPGGYLILSGILRTQFDSCCKAFKKQGIKIEKSILRGKWSSALCRRLP
ncbi:MAG: 50S ribosomal protein L11 methyltransferase [Chthoniobacterales bacterium]